MAKRHLTRRQSWRIEKIQEERAARAARRESRAVDELEGGDLGPEQTGQVIAHFGVQVEVESADGQVSRCHLRANLPALVTGDQVVWRAGNQGIGVIVAQLPRRSELCRPDMRGLLAGSGQRRPHRHRLRPASRTARQPDRPLPDRRRTCRHPAVAAAEQGRPGRREQCRRHRCAAECLPHPGLSADRGIGLQWPGDGRTAARWTLT